MTMKSVSEATFLPVTPNEMWGLIGGFLGVPSLRSGRLGMTGRRK